ncbi:MAG: hypothetical protein J6J36_00680 [Clostridia bacterium]|nr:hypothetical protein [Clostridia bacterium]
MKELSCENCQLSLHGYCSGGVKCYGGNPIYPPCAEIDDFDDEQWVLDYIESEERARKNRAQRQAAEKKKQEEKLHRQQLKKEYEQRNRLPLEHIKQLRNKIKINKKMLVTLERRKCYFESINRVNQLFREGNCFCPDDKDLKLITEQIEDINKLNESYNVKIEEIKKYIKEQEKIFKRNAKNG